MVMGLGIRPSNDPTSIGVRQTSAVTVHSRLCTISTV